MYINLKKKKKFLYFYENGHEYDLMINYFNSFSGKVKKQRKKILQKYF